jgi:heptaprenyl diphosphate synthase
MDNIRNSSLSCTWTKARKVAFGGVMTVLAMMFSYVESFVPAAPGVPGVKLGLANLVVVILLDKTSARSAWTVNVLRILMSGLLFSGLFGMVYSLAGCSCSFLAMMLLKKSEKFSIVGVSMLGGVAHNFGQILIAILLTGTGKLIYYFAVLILTGMGSGIFLGFIAGDVIRHLPKQIRAAAR